MDSRMTRRSALVLTGTAAAGTIAAGRPGDQADLQADPQAGPRADLVLHSGVVWTGDGTAEAVAVRGKRVVAVGSDHHVLRWAGDRTRRVDLRGAFVGPGFRDQHTHLITRALTGVGPEAYRPVYKPYDEKEAFESRRRTGQRHVEIHARGETPVDVGAHSPVTEKMKNDLLVMQEEVAKQGVTTVVEAGLRDLGALEALFQLAEEDKLKVRFLVRVAWGCMEEAAKLGWKTGVGNDWVKVLGVKLYSDGWLGPRTSALRRPYADDPYGFPRKGILFLEQERANRDVARARELGFNITTHAIGDRGLKVTLNAYEHNDVSPRDRWAIEHVQVVEDDLLERMIRGGVIASIQLSFATSDQRFAENALGRDRLRHAYRWRDMLRARLPMVGGTDFDIEALDPMWGLQRVVTRTEFDGTPPGGWRPDQRLDVPAAMRLITSRAAFASFEERERGTVEPGNYADLVVLRENPLTIPPDRLAFTTRLMTVVNGRIAAEGPVSYPPTA
ncbi:amidohydrolase [Actinomadura syzygii]|uniref:Amidohydrolase family protein n=1 Tax=Actinomadura syzygii TaxID=1427538 RepID=A0A5D0UJ14_9ACTN|nr:amidohydrolase family protein [Actinomadura syzygii]TYC17603.1 amidohydrolase family protein [Actinomadura syzygii]